MDPYAVRLDFPILKKDINGHRLVYLDNAATAQKPAMVIDGVADFYTRKNSNIHRGVHTLSDIASEEYEKARKKVQRFIGAGDPSEIVFTAGTTDSINLVARSLSESYITCGDEIIVTEMEHHSNLVPWQEVCRRTGASLKMLPMRDDGSLAVEELERLITPVTRLLALTHVSNVLGTINPCKEIAGVAHDHGVPVLVDGAQAVPHMPVNVCEMDCDFYAFSGHKMYAETGIGVLYGKKEWLERMPPHRFGGGMITEVELERAVYADPPLKFEAGTPGYAGAVSLGIAIDYVQSIGMDDIFRHESALVQYARECLQALPGTTLYGNVENTGAVSFNLQGIHHYDVGRFLDTLGIAIRTGTHCAIPVMDHYSVTGTARASFALYNTSEDVDVLVKGLYELYRSYSGKEQVFTGNRVYGTVDQVQDQVLRQLSGLGDRLAIYQYIVQKGEQLPRMPDDELVDENMLTGCQSRVWIHSHLDSDKMVIHAHSDARFTRGLLALLLEVLDGRRPDQIANARLYLFDRSGLQEQLSPNRANGLASIISHIRKLAREYLENRRETARRA